MLATINGLLIHFTGDSIANNANNSRGKKMSAVQRAHRFFHHSVKLETLTTLNHWNAFNPTYLHVSSLSASFLQYLKIINYSTITLHFSCTYLSLGSFFLLSFVHFNTVQNAAAAAVSSFDTYCTVRMMVILHRKEWKHAFLWFSANFNSYSYYRVVWPHSPFTSKCTCRSQTNPNWNFNVFFSFVMIFLFCFW